MPEKFSQEAQELIEVISAQKKPFAHKTLAGFIKEPGADEVLIERQPHIQLRKGVMAAILPLIADKLLVPSPENS